MRTFSPGRSLAIVLGFLALAAAIAWWQIAPSPSPVGDVPSSSGPGGGGVHPAGGVQGEEDPEQRIPADQGSAETSTRPAARGEQVDVTGPLEVYDPRGAPVLVSQGQLVYSEGSSQSGERRVGLITNNRWSIRAPANALIVPHEVVIRRDHRKGIVRSAPFECQEGAERALVADLLDGVRLEVVDSADGRQLEGVQVLLMLDGADPRSALLMPPTDGASGTLFVTGDSPLAIPCMGVTRSGWVRAKGYAWKTLALSGCEGSRRVVLRPGGDLTCVVQGDVSSSRDLELRIVDSSGGNLLVAEALTGQSVHVFSGLPVGDALVTLQRDGPVAWADVFALTRTSVFAGAMTTIELEVSSAREKSELGSLDVIVHCALDDSPGSWELCLMKDGENRSPGRVQSLASCRSDEAREGRVVKWEAGWLLPGTYWVVLKPGLDMKQVEVRAGEHSVLRFSAEPLVDVRIHVVDSKSGAHLSGAGIAVRSESAPETHGGWLRGVPIEGHHRLLLRRGRYVLRAGHTREYAEHSSELVVGGDGQIETVFLEPVTRHMIRVSVFESGAEVPLSIETWEALTCTPIPPCTGRFLGVSFRGTARSALKYAHCDVAVSEPGKYRIELRDPEGFEHDARLEVESRAGYVVDVAMQVVGSDR